MAWFIHTAYTRKKSSWSKLVGGGIGKIEIIKYLLEKNSRLIIFIL